MYDAAEQEEQPVDPRVFVEGVTQSVNIAADLSEGELDKIAQQALDDYKTDKDSMSDWLEKSKRGLELAQLVKDEKKSYPFEGSANVKYPLVTSAALQFNARAYPAVVPSDQVVRPKLFGADPQGAKAKRGARVASHMSYQLTNEIDEWEEETDRLLVLLPIVGSIFRKVWFDPVLGRTRMRLVESGKMIVNDKVRSLSQAPRLTEEIELYPSEIESRERCDLFLPLEYTEGEDRQAAEEFIEQHTLLDLDDDGYDEPYIVTVHVEQQKVVRIVADFEPESVKFKTEQRQTLQPMQDQMTGAVVEMPVMAEVPVGIKAIERASYFVHYQFMPGLGGGLHGTGLGVLLGDISESINTIINMMLDSGHYNSLGGGFIGSDLRLKGGAQRFRPGEYKMINSKGADIRSAIVPVKFGGPDAVMFQMLGMLIDSGREIASVKDIMTGDTGTKNMTATTTLALIEQGMMVFTAAYKRIFRSLRKEYKLLAKINSTTVDAETYNAFHDQQPEQGPNGEMVPPQPLDPAADYSAADMDIVPVADPRSVTKMQEAAKAQIVMELAQAGMLDQNEASMRVLESASIPDTEELMPKPDPMAEPMAMLAMAAAEADVAIKKAEAMSGMVEVDRKIAEIGKMKAEAIATLEGVELDKAKQRFDGYEAMLTDARERLKIVVQASTRGMGGKPGNAGNPPNPAPSLPSAAAAGFGGLPIGQPGAAGTGGGFA